MKTQCSSAEDAKKAVIAYLGSKGMEDPIVIGVREIQISRRFPQANYYVVVTTNPEGIFKVFSDGSVSSSSS